MDFTNASTYPSEVMLHACCAPCSSAIVEWMLDNRISPTIYYYNPNIFPREEYEIRKQESKRHAESLGIRWIDGDYNHEQWLCQVCALPYDATDEERQHCDMAREPERGARCLECFRLRLIATAHEALRQGITCFATTLASSRWKSIEQINQAGMAAQQETPGTVFWSRNWRKGGLYERRNQLLRQYGFYNQQYCGCEFSLKVANQRKRDS